MKKWLLIGGTGLILSLAGCTAGIVTTRPHDVVYSRTPSPGPDYIWISGDWIWAGGTYRWREGHWAHRRPGRRWHEGYWEGHGKGYRWHRGHW